MTSTVYPIHNTLTSAPRALSASRVIVYEAITVVVLSLAAAGIIWQQIVHTPWGLPGHRGLFWLSMLIAVRWATDRPGVALGTAAAASTGILLLDPSMGVHVATYLIAGFLVDLTAKSPLIRRHRWTMIGLAPLILLVNLINPFVHNLALEPLSSVITGMWFYTQGHLLWGLAAGLTGMGTGVLGRALLRRLTPPPPHERLLPTTP